MKRVLCALATHKYVKTPLSQLDTTGEHYYLRCRRCGHERGAPDVSPGQAVDKPAGLHVIEYPTW